MFACQWKRVSREGEVKDLESKRTLDGAGEKQAEKG